MKIPFGNLLLESDTEISAFLDAFRNMDQPLQAAIAVVGILIGVVACVSIVISIILGISYVQFNRRRNSAGLTGAEAARELLDRNGLQHIKIKVTGSLIFVNSYSHYFKKIRLRRLTYKKNSLTSLAMGSQKAALAVMDKENDPDMKTRNRLFPFVTFGPIAFLPLVIIGAVIDYFLFKGTGTVTVILLIVALAFYVFSLILSLVTLKTEKKAQERAYRMLSENKMATDEELVLIKKLFKLYNIQYINDIILSLLELLYYVLQLVSLFSGGSADFGTNKD